MIVVVLCAHALLISHLQRPHSPLLLPHRPHHLLLHLMRLRHDLLHLLPLATGLADYGEVVFAVEVDEVGEVHLQVYEQSSPQVLNIVACELQLQDQLLIGDSQQFLHLTDAVASHTHFLQLQELLDAL